MDHSRRGFLKMLGLGAGAAALLPVDELIDRLAFARSPTASIYVSTPLSVQQWEDYMFLEYARASPFFFHEQRVFVPPAATSGGF